MGRFRTSGWCAGLGLFAIAFQLFLTFGHVHLADRAALVAAVSSSVSASRSDVGAPSQFAVLGAQDGVDAVAPNDDGDKSHDPICSICLAITLASAAFFTPAPTLIVPVVSSNLVVIPSSDAGRTTSLSTPFWSRGPPEILSATA